MPSNGSGRRIILTRPAVEAGERLGFLPGDLAQKVDPYLRPLYDALYDLMGFDRVAKLFERGSIEIAPLAFMRAHPESRLHHSRRGQNTTPEQMKMFLTRIGIGAKAVVTGDLTQVDLQRGQVSGLRGARGAGTWEASRRRTSSRKGRGATSTRGSHRGGLRLRRRRLREEAAGRPGAQEAASNGDGAAMSSLFAIDGRAGAGRSRPRHWRWCSTMRCSLHLVVAADEIRARAGGDGDGHAGATAGPENRLCLRLAQASRQDRGQRPVPIEPFGSKARCASDEAVGCPGVARSASGSMRRWSRTQR